MMLFLLLLVLLLLLLLLLLCHQAQIKLSPQEGADLLQLAINCSRPQTVKAALMHLPATEEAAATHMPALLEPAVARRLLLTAAARQAGQDASVVQHMVGLAYLQQHVDAATLEAMLQPFVVRRQLSDSCITNSTSATLKLKLQAASDVVKLMCQLPAAAQLSNEAVTRLMMAVIRAYSWTMSDLCKLPALQQLSKAAAIELLQADVRRSSLPRAFYELPAVQQLSMKQVLQLLRAAVKQGKMPEGFCRLPAAEDISNDAVFQLLLLTSSAGTVQLSKLSCSLL
jgi:hypothetical protein